MCYYQVKVKFGPSYSYMIFGLFGAIYHVLVTSNQNSCKKYILQLLRIKFGNDHILHSISSSNI